MWALEELEHISNTHTLEAQAQLERITIIETRIKDCDFWVIKRNVNSSEFIKAIAIEYKEISFLHHYRYYSPVID